MQGGEALAEIASSQEPGRTGAAKGDLEPLDTHAWLDAGGVRVTGYPVSDRFVEIACFV